MNNFSDRMEMFTMYNNDWIVQRSFWWWQRFLGTQTFDIRELSTRFQAKDGLHAHDSTIQLSKFVKLKWKMKKKISHHNVIIVLQWECLKGRAPRKLIVNWENTHSSEEHEWLQGCKICCTGGSYLETTNRHWK